MKTKNTRLLLSAVLMMCCMSVFSENGTNIGGIYYILDQANKTAVVTYGNPNGTSEYVEILSIPSEVIHDETTYTVTSIGDRAFINCSSLESVDIPSTVMSIGEQAFCGCSSLERLLIPERVNSIGNSAFQGCSGLTSITIPESVRSIGNFAFKDCSVLTSVSISEGVENIGEYAFGSCSKLTTITIPSSVKSLGCRPFVSCANLTSIIVLATNPPVLDGNYFGVVKGVLLHVPDVQAYENSNWEGITDIRNVANYKPDALADIYKAMQGERSSAYLNGLVQNNLNAINNSDDYAVINKNRVEAIGKLKPVISIYKEIKTAELGSLTTPQTGSTAVKVTKGDKEVILYAPDKVEYIIIKK